MKVNSENQSASRTMKAGEGEQAIDQSPEPVSRAVYVPMRLAEIARRITELASEREKMTAELKSPHRENGPAAKELRQRRAYLAQRLAELRHEQATLFQEKKIIGAAGRQNGGKDKKSRTKVPNRHATGPELHPLGTTSEDAKIH